MSRQILIDNTVRKLSKLPDSKIKEINDFADFLISKMDDNIILQNIKQLTSDSKSFDFLKDEEDLYDEGDLKEKYK